MQEAVQHGRQRAATEGPKEGSASCRRLFNTDDRERPRKAPRKVPVAQEAVSQAGFDVDQEEDGDPDEDPEAVYELHDRLIKIRCALDDLPVILGCPLVLP